ncbi:MAG: hypothetical protein MJ146_01100 [Clostridia bacterium]|nr:hypothetical protein [Clostridia bacterium]
MDRKILGITVLTSALISWLMYDTFLLTPVFSLAYFPVEKLYKRYLEKKEKRKLEKEFLDFLYYISISFSLGRNMMQAIEEALVNLRELYGKDSKLVADLDNALKIYVQSNVEDLNFAKGSGNQDMVDFFDVYSQCKVTGGDMTQAINAASKVISEKINVTREIENMSSQRKLEGRIILAMPFLIIGFLKVTGPDYLSVMYSTLAGRIIMTITLGICALSYYLVERITRVNI